VQQKLSEQEYRIVYLKYWEELAMREIGEIEHLSESRVCKIHARLIERLRERLGAGSD
jgi:RNA polymerase sigma factor for flagellar operon FliA